MKEDIQTMIQNVISGKYDEAQSNFNQVFSQIAADRLELMKQETGSLFFNKEAQ